jgi:flagellar biosynthesis component FlhA
VNTTEVTKLNLLKCLEGETLAAITANVELMLQLNKELQAATLPDQKEQLKARIGHTDEKINRMVYQLYGLTAEEIQIIENFR